ncbi:MAG: TolC family protein [Candidatus Omnitrophica bacterium]|nr:TolC family protein [Candidatus Omnitrophota bacterium]MCM8769304.1 TolC family protein [Candidatus Omnitrophota bacterium]
MKAIVGFLLFIFLLTGCSPGYFVRQADREVESILKEKEKEISRQANPIAISDSDARTETTFLTLKDTLMMAARRNREYETRKEEVYLRALELTGRRFLYGWRSEGKGSGTWTNNGQAGWSAGVNWQLIRWLADGAEMSFDFTHNFLRYLTGDKTKSFQTIMQLNLLQPLLRGAGRRIFQEELTQADREVVYAVRSFLRYQRTFSVEVAKRYFRLLLAQNAVKNYLANYQFLAQTRERIEMMAQAGRLPPFQADQARQNELQAYQDWIVASNDYQRQMDDFKTFLAIPLSQPVELDKDIMDLLLIRGVTAPGFNLEECLRQAERHRLDLLTAADEVVDAKRKVAVAKDNLRSYLSLKIELESASEQAEKPTWKMSPPVSDIGLDLSLPFTRVSQRNVYRRALINLERKQREYLLKRDTIANEVRGAYLTFEETYRTYLNQRSSLSLAEKRVESTDLLLQAGRASTRDLLEAQEAYTRAKNALSQAMVNYQIAYLQLLSVTEMLEVDQTGVWKGDIYEKMVR